jgi:hypothetical protein
VALQMQMLDRRTVDEDGPIDEIEEAETLAVEA